jgi:hypothetical protein
MHLLTLLLLAVVAFLLARAASGDVPDASDWTIYITNDNCPDYTWGFTEEQTRQAFADIVRGHLDEMQRTDGWSPEEQSRYNMAVTQEALCFVERYPERREELIRRIQEGRLFVSPYLCNSLWGFQSVEGSIRALYPARRLEREWGIGPLDVAEHIEEPSLPWGVASILAGCGVRWLSNPFYSYGSTFSGLTNPPLFAYEGPDGSRIRVVMDPWACNRWSYMQGGKLLREPTLIGSDWLPHYRALGESYPLRAILASGTHGDIKPTSGEQAREFAEAIRQLNDDRPAGPRLVNASLPRFCQVVDQAEAAEPFLPRIRGCFGHAWDVWPVSLAKYAAEMREGERRMLAAEALLAAASSADPGVAARTRQQRRRAEWCWAMLGDHAWNGTSDENKRHNAELRRGWSAELNRLAAELTEQGWQALGLTEGERDVTVFNSLSVPRAGLLRAEIPEGAVGLSAEGRSLECQVVEEDDARSLYAMSPEIPGFGFAAFEVRSSGSQVPGSHALTDATSRVLADGPLLARVRIEGTVAGIEVTNDITVYAGLDWVEFDLRIHKPATDREQRLCQVFPVLRDGAVLRVESTGAVIRPKPQPEGDLLPGADTTRFAVQGFIDASLPSGPGVTIAPLDAFVLRTDLEPVTFEALGNDQNYREVLKDQHGVTDFRFRYALRAHAGAYDGAEATAWSRNVATPLLAVPGRVPSPPEPPVYVDPRRAIATCLKPADDGLGCILRLWELAGQSGPVTVGVGGYGKATETDLLERDREELAIEDGQVTVDLRAHGFGAVRLRYD